MKKLFLVAIIAAVTSTSAFAQEGGESRQGGRRNDEGAKWMKELNLTSEQSQKMDLLNADFRTKQQALHEQHRADVKAILTAQQQAKMDELRQNKGKQWAGKGKDKQQHAGKKMNFDEATQAKLKALKEDYTAQRDAVDRSRIAPAAQQEKKKELSNKFRAERKQIIADAKTKSVND